MTGTEQEASSEGHVEPAKNDGSGKLATRGFSDHAIHLLRTSQINTLTLSQMADQKASILIGATFVVFSLAVTRLIGSEIHFSMLALAVTAFLSSLCAVIAVLPSLGQPTEGSDDINLLFFGHFSALETEEWSAQLLERLESDEALFLTMLRDIHQNGQVLYRRKYRFLSYAYRIFLIGLAITIAIYFAEWAGNLSG